MLTRSEVVVIVECAALRERDHQKAVFCVHTQELWFFCDARKI